MYSKREIYMLLLGSSLLGLTVYNGLTLVAGGNLRDNFGYNLGYFAANFGIFLYLFIIKTNKKSE